MCMPFMRSHEARPVTDPPKSELWEESTLLCLPIKTLGRIVSPCPHLFTPQTASLASHLANWLVALSLTVHVNAVSFKSLTGTPAWCWLIVFLNYSSVES